MDPNNPVFIPKRMSTSTVIFGPVTVRHVGWLAIPLVGVFLLETLIPPLSAIETPLFVVAGIFGIAMAFGKKDGIPYPRYLRILYRHNKRPKAYTSSDAKTQPPSRDFVKLAAIRNGVVFYDLGGGKAQYATILEVTPRNFQQQRHVDRAAALRAYYDVLVGSDKNLQILVTSRPYDPTDYFRGFIKAIKKNPSATFRKHSVKFLRWFEGYALDHGILERRYFVIASTQGTLYKEKDLSPTSQEALDKTVRHLKGVINNASERFRGSGAGVRVLSSAECLRVVQDALTPPPFTAESKLDHANATLDFKAKETANLMVPDIKVEKTHLKVGNDFVRTIVVREYPQQIGIAWLEDILHMDERIAVTVHMEPKPDAVALKSLKNASRDLRTNMVIKGNRDTSEEQFMLEQVEAQRRQLLSRQTHFMEVTVLIRVHAPTLRHLDTVSDRVVYALRNLTIEPLIEPYSQEDAFVATLPFGVNKLTAYQQTMDGFGGAATYPFLSSSIRHAAGSLLGFHATTGLPYIVDRWEFFNYTRLICGMSGSGKSFLTKLDMMRTLIRHPDAWILGIDPLGEFTAVTKILGGEVVHVGAPGTIINPFDLDLSGTSVQEEDGKREANPYIRQLGFLRAFFKVSMEGRLTLEEEAMLAHCFVETYARKGIHDDPKSWGHTAPTLSDLAAVVYSLATGDDEYRAGVAKRLDLYISDIMNTPIGYMDGQTNVKVHGNVVMFNLEDLDESFRRPFMFALLDYVEKRLRRGPVAVRKVVPIDEAHILLDVVDTAARVAKMSRYVRHFNAGMDIVTQTADTFLKNAEASTICTNSAQTILMRQKNFGPPLQYLFGLDEDEAQAVCTMGQAEGAKHSVGVFLAGQAKHMIIIDSSDIEKRLVTTKPSDLAAMAKQLRDDKAAEAAAKAPNKAAPKPAVNPILQAIKAVPKARPATPAVKA